MFYCVEDSDGDIAFHTTDPNDPDLQHHVDKWSYFDPKVVEYPEIWEVWLDEEDEDNKALYSIHSTAEGAMRKLDTFPNATIRKA